MKSRIVRELNHKLAEGQKSSDYREEQTNAEIDEQQVNGPECCVL